jgi:hypothetical protein
LRRQVNQCGSDGHVFAAVLTTVVRESAFLPTLFI